MSRPIFKVDSFTDRAFAGNPAGVCLLDAARSEAWMQSVAAEMNVAETAFLVPRGEVFDLRWFTPTVEVDLCGHATLASAHVLWEEKILAPDVPAQFSTRSGMLTAVQERGSIVLDFPAEPPEETAAPVDLAKAIGAPLAYCGRNRMDYLVEVADEATVRGVHPAPSALLPYPCRGVIVTARAANGEFDFVSRFFAPAAGVDEDPVTGSAHCVLGPYWMEKLGRASMRARQVSRRGGELGVRVEGERVVLTGRAVIVGRGTLSV